MSQLVQELVFDGAARTPDAIALRAGGQDHGYAALAADIGAAAAGLRALRAGPGERVAVWMEPCAQAVHALFGAVAAGAAMVPIDPLAGTGQAAAILRDCEARLLVTTTRRLAALAPLLERCSAVRTVVVCGDVVAVPGIEVAAWDACLAGGHGRVLPGGVDTDIAALLYAGAREGGPRGIVLSHRNLVAAAASSARCVGLQARDRVLASLPLALDFGLNQLTAAFASGACAVLEQRPLRELPALAARERISVMAALPPAWAALARHDWSMWAPRSVVSAGGPVPRATVEALRRALPGSRIHLMYGAAEAFRATCLAPGEIERRPDSIGRPVPCAGVLVLRPDGSRCAPDESGELVQRGPLVALGYWNDPQGSAQRFRPLPPRPGLARPETALWSGEAVRMDRDGYLYLVRATEETISTCGREVSPRAVEDVVYGTGLVEEAAAVGVAHPVLGQVIAVLARPRSGARLDSAILFGACREQLPGWMLPAMVDVRRAPLPRHPNGKIDRALLAGELAPLFAEATS